MNHATKYIFCFSALGEKLMVSERGAEILFFFGDKATSLVVRAADCECRVTFPTFFQWTALYFSFVRKWLIALLVSLFGMSN